MNEFKEMIILGNFMKFDGQVIIIGFLVSFAIIVFGIALKAVLKILKSA